MLCSHCNKREANFHYKKLTQGKLSELHLCTECATQLGYIGGAEPSFGFDDILSDFFSVLKPEAVSSTLSCPICHTTYEQFKKTGFVGCSDCYDVFKGDIEKMLSRIQPATTHKGKIAGQTGEKIQKANQIKELRDKLKASIIEERYEDAAKIRDQIKELEKGGEQNG